MAARRYPDVRYRFWARVVTSPGCWLWVGHRNNHGYGKLHFEGRQQFVHRIALRLLGIDIAAGAHVMHSCDTPACVRPEHLSIGTCRENMRDSARKGRNVMQRHPERNGLLGERSPHARLTEGLVRELRRRRENGETYADMARELGVDIGTVSLAVRRKTWRHVA